MVDFAVDDSDVVAVLDAVELTVVVPVTNLHPANRPSELVSTPRFKYLTIALHSDGAVVHTPPPPQASAGEVPWLTIFSTSLTASTALSQLATGKT